MKNYLAGQHVVIMGGTGTLGSAMAEYLADGRCRAITIFSRDECKQWAMRAKLPNVRFVIGDIRNYADVCAVLDDADVVINAAALKQVPSCERFTLQAIKTNCLGFQNIVQAINDHKPPVHTVVSISTDKACKPVNAMGMTKALQERLMISANINSNVRFIGVRYGNVLASRGSVIPLFRQQISDGGPVTITHPDMTRFLLTVERAVETITFALQHALAGEIVIPITESAKITGIAEALVFSSGKEIDIQITGIRPGEKIHEVLVSEEEMWRTVVDGKYYIVKPAIKELYAEADKRKDYPLDIEYSSRMNNISQHDISTLLFDNGMLGFQ